MCLCKFGQNLPIGSGDRVQTMSNADADADGDPHQKQYVPPPLYSVGGLGGEHKYLINTDLSTPLRRPLFYLSIKNDILKIPFVEAIISDYQ